MQLTGNGIQLSLVVQPNVLDFGNTLINTTVKKSVTLINKSTAAVTGITATVGGGDPKLFTVDDAPATLGRRRFGHRGHQLRPDRDRGPVAGHRRPSQGSDKENTTLNLFGEPVGVALTLAPNPINFGYVPL